MAAAAWTQWPLVARRFRAKESVRDTNTLGHALHRCCTRTFSARRSRRRRHRRTAGASPPGRSHCRRVDAERAREAPRRRPGRASAVLVRQSGGRRREGSGIYSQHPLDDVMRHDGYAAEQLSARGRGAGWTDAVGLRASSGPAVAAITAGVGTESWRRSGRCSRKFQPRTAPSSSAVTSTRLSITSSTETC